MSKGRGTFKVIASGNTYPVREDLKSWAFRWDPDKKAWTRDQVSEQERRQFEGNVDNGPWDGVELEFEEEPITEMDRILGIDGEKV